MTHIRFCDKSSLGAVGVRSRQAGALCLRDSGGVREVLLISSLDLVRWGIPKGHIEPDEPIWITAEREAFEEAGIVGTAERSPIGGYFYRKSLEDQTYFVRVHRLDFKMNAVDYPEKNLRTVAWVPLEIAMSIVSRHGLRKLLRDFWGRS